MSITVVGNPGNRFLTIPPTVLARSALQQPNKKRARQNRARCIF